MVETCSHVPLLSHRRYASPKPNRKVYFSFLNYFLIKNLHNCRKKERCVNASYTYCSTQSVCSSIRDPVHSVTNWKWALRLIWGFDWWLYPGPVLPLWLKSYIYSGQAAETSPPGGPSGQQTMPSHSGEQKPSVGTKEYWLLKLEPQSVVLSWFPALLGCRHLVKQQCCMFSRIHLPFEK